MSMISSIFPYECPVFRICCAYPEDSSTIFDVNSDIVDVYKNEDLKMDCLHPKHVVVDKKVKYCD
jgi:hypothetical protein